MHLHVKKEDRPVRACHAVFGRGRRDGDRRMQVDQRPQGILNISTMNDRRRFYEVVRLSYPGLNHAAYGPESGIIGSDEHATIKKSLEVRKPLPWDMPPGGAVTIHDCMPSGAAVRLFLAGENWTDGSIAQDNSGFDGLYRAVSLGAPVKLLP
jgi:hypothetical protein